MADCKTPVADWTAVATRVPRPGFFLGDDHAACAYLLFNSSTATSLSLPQRHLASPRLKDAWPVHACPSAVSLPGLSPRAASRLPPAHC